MIALHAVASLYSFQGQIWNSKVLCSHCTVLSGEVKRVELESQKCWPQSIFPHMSENTDTAKPSGVQASLKYLVPCVLCIAFAAAVRPTTRQRGFSGIDDGVGIAGKYREKKNVSDKEHNGNMCKHFARVGETE